MSSSPLRPLLLPALAARGREPVVRVAPCDLATEAEQERAADRGFRGRADEADDDGIARALPRLPAGRRHEGRLARARRADDRQRVVVARGDVGPDGREGLEAPDEPGAGPVLAEALVVVDLLLELGLRLDLADLGRDDPRQSLVDVLAELVQVVAGDAVVLPPRPVLADVAGEVSVEPALQVIQPLTSLLVGRAIRREVDEPLGRRTVRVGSSGGRLGRDVGLQVVEVRDRAEEAEDVLGRVGDAERAAEDLLLGGGGLVLDAPLVVACPAERVDGPAQGIPHAGLVLPPAGLLLDRSRPASARRSPPRRRRPCAP